MRFINTIKYINITFLFTLICCAISYVNETSLADTNTVSSDLKNTLINSTDTKPDYIVFGRFCGECSGECATMYKFDIANNKLFADHTDSYWKQRSGESMKFSTGVTDPKAVAYTKELSENLPDFILNASSPAQKFGCPDCTDGCGLFFEIKKDNAIKKFYIDNQITKLEGDVKKFAEKLKAVIEKMK